eukprot:203104_1
MASLFSCSLIALHLVPCICQSYPYLYHDTFQSISNWQMPDDAAIVSSPNCPSFGTNTISTPPLIKENKICISNSYRELFDGQYLFESYNHDLDVSLFLHSGPSRYFSAQITSDNYEYNIHSFTYDRITKARCIIPKSIASDTFNAHDLAICVGRWQFYDGDEWNLDANMTSVPCQSRCFEGNDKEQINSGVFKYHSFNVTRRTPIYYCSECGVYNYLYGWPWITLGHLYIIGPDPNDSSGWSYCPVGSNLADEYIFSLDDCIYWKTTDGTNWIDDNSIPYLCDDDARGNWTKSFENIDTDPARKVCINGATDPDINGEYNWLYYDAVLRGSTYLNANGSHIHPSIDIFGHYSWVIGDNSMRCNISDAVQGYIFDINDCVNGWEINTNGAWIKGSAVFMTECTDICVSGHSKDFMPDGTIFSYVYFNVTRQTNVYVCEKCTVSGYDGVYLYGWAYDWYIGPDANDASRWSKCYIGSDLDPNYVFNIQDCLYGRIPSPLWQTYNGVTDSDEDEDDVIMTKCNEASHRVCMLMGSNATKEYVVNGTHTGFALGFDVNTANMASGVPFTVEYSCSGVFKELTIFSEAANVPYTGIIYQLPTSACNDQRSIAIRFDTKDHVYADSVYLYYNTTNTLFMDSMTTYVNWDISTLNQVSTEVQSDYCPTGGSCLRLRANQNEIVSMITTIDLSNKPYKYKDLLLQWSAVTTGLNSGSYFIVEYQCDPNYLYTVNTDELCLLKQYDDVDADCTESICAAQSYNLPSKCDFSSEVMIKLTLQSNRSFESVYIDYVTLFHSDTSGLTGTECIYTPTNAEDFDDVLVISLVVAIVVFCIVVIFVCVKKRLHSKKAGIEFDDDDIVRNSNQKTTSMPTTTTQATTAPQLELEEDVNRKVKPQKAEEEMKQTDFVNRKATWPTVQPPEEFLCPISAELMVDPVMVTQSGWTYDRVEIEAWIRENGTDPNTRHACSVDDLVPNRTLRDAIMSWKADMGLPLQENEKEDNYDHETPYI